MRPICQSCNQRARAIAYYRTNGQIQYRRLCEHCIKRKRHVLVPLPRWKSSGYKKKHTCDQCGFRAEYSAQLLVYHIDGDLNNNLLRNLKTICLNCTIKIVKTNLLWSAGDLEPDL
jgi:hypothetical protein